MPGKLVLMVMTFMVMISVFMGMGGNFSFVLMFRIWIFTVRLGMVVNMRVRM